MVTLWPLTACIGQEVAPAKRRKLCRSDEEEFLERSASNFHASTSWSPEDSYASSSSCFASPADGSQQFTPGSASGVTRHGSVQSVHRLVVQNSFCQQWDFPVQSWPQASFQTACSTFYTPPAQVGGLSDQEAPRLKQPYHPTSAAATQSTWLQIRLPAPHLAHAYQEDWARTDPLAQQQAAAAWQQCGTKRGYYSGPLESYAIASNLAYGLAGTGLPKQQQSLASSCSQPLQVHPLPSTRQLAANTSGSNGLSTAQRLVCGSAWKVQGSAVISSMAYTQQLPACAPRQLRSSLFTGASSFWPPTRTQASAFSCSQVNALPAPISRSAATVCLPRAPVTPVLLVEQWARALGLLPDTVYLTLHMLNRAQTKLSFSNSSGSSGQLVLVLLGCLWLAAKHEECRIGLPTASKIAALVSECSHGCIQAATVNKAELLVLRCLGWQPLKGWDDLRFVKGRPRAEMEILELKWLSS